jgi:2-methylcitrate dehydratase PrpD
MRRRFCSLVSGEYFGVDRTRFLRSVTLGYDIGTRVLMTLGGLVFQIHTHRSAHSRANTFGAATAACSRAFLSKRHKRCVDDFSFAAAHDKTHMQDPEVLRQGAKVRLVPDEELERLYPKREAMKQSWRLLWMMALISRGASRLYGGRRRIPCRETK